MRRNIISRPALISAAALLLFSLTISRFPLFNYLGYEFSTSLSLIIPLFFGPVTLSRLRESFGESEQVSPGRFIRSVLAAMGISGILLAIPFTIISLNAGFIRNCDYAEGVAFFLLIPTITAVFSVSLAAWCWTMFRRAIYWYLGCLGLVFLYALYVGIWHPQIYSYSVLYGLFPGFSYDEILVITKPLALCRLLTLILSLALLAWSSAVLQGGGRMRGLMGKISGVKSSFARNPMAMTATVLTFVLAVAWWFRAPLGFESPHSYVRAELGSSYATPHFIIYYSTGSFNAREIGQVAAEHEFRFAQVRLALGTLSAEPISSYIYPDESTKLRLVGTSSTNIAKPWLREIHFNKEDWKATLKHELTHIMAGEFGMLIFFNAHYHIGLVEGLAMAVEDRFQHRSLHEYAASMLRFGIVREPEELITAMGFITHQSSLSYVMMGSFCKYLIDRHGFEKYRSLYGGASVGKVYGMPYKELVKEWQDYLMEIDVPAEWREHIEYFFKRPSIFAKECARTIARLNGEGWRLLEEERQPERAMEQFALSLGMSRNSEAFTGLTRSAFEAARFDTVVRLIGQNGGDSALGLLRYYGDALWALGDTSQARRAFVKLRRIDLSDAYNETLELRLAALDDIVLAPLLVPVFVGTSSADETILALERLRSGNDHPLVKYLLARAYYNRKRLSEASALIDSTVRFSNPTIAAGVEEFLGTCFFALEEFDVAARHFDAALAYHHNMASRKRLAEAIARCEWYRIHASELKDPQR